MKAIKIGVKRWKCTESTFFSIDPLVKTLTIMDSLLQYLPIEMFSKTIFWYFKAVVSDLANYTFVVYEHKVTLELYTSIVKIVQIYFSK